MFQLGLCAVRHSAESILHYAAHSPSRHIFANISANSNPNPKIFKADKAVAQGGRLVKKGRKSRVTVYGSKIFLQNVLLKMLFIQHSFYLWCPDRCGRDYNPAWHHSKPLPPHYYPQQPRLCPLLNQRLHLRYPQHLW
jgi:hypothetical protein